MKYRNKSGVIIHLTLCGEKFNPNNVTEKLGIAPNYIREKNDKLENGNIFGQTEWGFETEWIENQDLDEVLNIFFSSIREKASQLKRIALECNANWSLLIGVKIWNEQKPILYLSIKNVQFLSEIGADIGFDYYCYGFEDIEEHKH
ncbi:DUF4279 domain-containing protein [Harryflintia acetispora]|uniref:DUF4279 domain-containing protein n=1 Tax=Harryflintia acetispora TaxID=1849041 RepID=UPI00104559CC|nr:DUF4279 domain-containing protein [Harryflintia acetispora]